MQADPFAPPFGQSALGFIAIDDGIEVRAAEQCQHREVGLAVATVRRGVDQNHASGRPHHIAAPQIAVQTGRRVVIIEASGLAVRYHRIDGVAGFGAEPIRGRVAPSAPIARGHRTSPRCHTQSATSEVAGATARRTHPQSTPRALHRKRPRPHRGCAPTGGRIRVRRRARAARCRGGPTSVACRRSQRLRHTALRRRRPKAIAARRLRRRRSPLARWDCA